MYCRNCGNQMDDVAAVCVQCGTAKGVGQNYCPNCGAQTIPNAVVCTNCGVALNAAPAAGAGQKSKMAAAATAAIIFCFHSPLVLFIILSP